MKNIAFIDLETNSDRLQIEDMGAVCSNGAHFHENSFERLLTFLKTDGLYRWTQYNET